MRQASKRIPDSAEKTVRDIRRATRRHHSAEEKIRIVLEGLRGEVSIAELCRKEGNQPEPLLPLVEGVSGGGQKAARRRHDTRGAGCDRTMAPTLQHNPSAFFARLSATGTGGHLTRCQPAYSAAAAA